VKNLRTPSAIAHKTTKPPLRHPTAWCLVTSTLTRQHPGPEKTTDTYTTPTPTMELFGYLFLLLSLLSSTILADAGGCYLPNGKSVDLAARCWDAGGGKTGLCCQSGDKCLNNTLCAGQFAGEPFYYRGYCADASWKHPGCPKFCLGSDQKDHIPAVYRCNGDDKKKQGGWYCGGVGEPRDDDCEAGYFRLSGGYEINCASRSGECADG